MSHFLRVALAGYSFELNAGDGFSVTLPAGWSPFVTSSASLPLAARFVVVGANTDQARDLRTGETIWRTGTWRLGRAADDSFVLSIHVLPDEKPLPVARFSSDFSEGLLVRIAGRNGASTPHALNYPVDQIAVANALWPKGVGIVHAAAVVFEGAALLLCGRSGAGKTTLSRLCRTEDALLLNDDRQFVWRRDSAIMVSATPWHGLEPAIHSGTYPVAAVLHLEHAPAEVCEPLSGADAAAALLRNAVMPYYNRTAVAAALAWVDDITANVPSFRFGFAPRASAALACRKIAAREAKTATPSAL